MGDAFFSAVGLTLAGMVSAARTLTDACVVSFFSPLAVESFASFFFVVLDWEVDGFFLKKMDAAGLSVFLEVMDVVDAVDGFYHE